MTTLTTLFWLHNFRELCISSILKAASVKQYSHLIEVYDTD